MALTIHVGDTVTFVQTLLTQSGAPLDLSGATTLSMKFKPQSASTVTKTAVLTTDGTDGKMQYTTLVTDLNVAGNWFEQSYVVTPSFTGHGHKNEFYVEEVL